MIVVTDKELEPLVNLMNHPKLGMRTQDCCFGHPEDRDRRVNHHTYSFVGFRIVDKAKASAFWVSFFKNHFGKITVCHFEEGLAQFHVAQCNNAFVDRCFSLDDHDQPVYLKYSLEIVPWHNPAFLKEGTDEKKAAIAMLEAFIKEYIA